MAHHSGHRILLVLLTAATVPFMPVSAQPGRLRFDRITVEQGLSNNTVKHIHQDRRGFLWITTDNGLNRYDGYSFRIFRHDPGDSTSLANDVVNVVAERSDGRLWVGTRSGLDLLDPSTGRFEHFRHRPDDPGSLPHDQIRAVVASRTGRLWVATGDGTVSYRDPGTDAFVHLHTDVDDPRDLAGAVVNELLEDRDGKLWVGTSGAGLSVIDPADGSVARYTHDPDDPESLASNYVASVQETADGALILGLWEGGVARMDLDRPGRFKHIRSHQADPSSLSSDNLRMAFVDRGGALWAATANQGLNLAAGGWNDPRFAHFRHRPSDPFSLSDTDVITGFQDRSGIVWFGTWRGGLNRWDPSTRQFGHTYHDPSDDRTIGGNEVTALLEDRRGTVWVGTWDGGLSRRDPRSEGFVTYRHDPNDPGSLPNDRIMSLYEDGRGVIWVGTWAGGLARINRETGRFKTWVRRRGDPGSGPIGAVQAFAEDRDGGFWVGSARGIARMDGDRFLNIDDASDPDLDVAALMADSAGSLWIGFNGGGLAWHDPESGRRTRYRHDPDDPTSLASDFVTSLFASRTGALWVGTASGVDLLDPSTGRFSHFGTAEGLPDGVVGAVIEDERGRLWVSTQRGLSRRDPDTGSFTNFDTGDGLQGLRFGRAGFRSATGRLYFGGGNGFNAFHPDSIHSTHRAPPVVITRLDLPGSGSGIDVSAREDVVLSYGSRVFTLDFALLDFHDPSNHRYAYRMEGVTEDWVDLGTEHALTLTGLGPGTYRLEVRGSNGTGDWSPQAAVLSITITPPWWRTVWAYLLYALVFAGTLYAARRYELNRAALKHRLTLEAATTEKLRELDHEKSRFLANLSHEFRTPLTLIVGPLQKLIDSRRDDPVLTAQHAMMLRNARRLQRLINQILDLSRIEAGFLELHASPFDLNGFVRSIVQLMTPLAEREQVLLVGPDPEPIVVPFDPEHMEKVVGNLLSNALKFTPDGGRVDVVVQAFADRVEVVVRDTGVGIPPAKLPHVFDRFYQADTSSRRVHEGTGIGLALVKELVELHGGTVGASSAPGAGSTFTVSLPRSEPDDAADRGAPPVEGRIRRPARPDPVSGDGADEAEAPESPAIDIPRVLVVDDNADVRAFLRSVLRAEYDVFDAVDGVDGLETAREVLPDVVIADVMMPRMNGLELSRALRDDDMLGSVPVILLTARAAATDEIEGLGTGADHYVRKPFEPSVLVARVRNVLAQRERLKAYFSADEPTPRPPDSPFVSKLLEILDRHLDDTGLSVDVLADAMALSPSQLRRRTRQELGETPNELIRRLRLERAERYLREGSGTISEIAYAVGFNSIHYFSRAYRGHFGVPPSDHLRRNVES